MKVKCLLSHHHSSIQLLTLLMTEKLRICHFCLWVRCVILLLFQILKSPVGYTNNTLRNVALVNTVCFCYILEPFIQQVCLSHFIPQSLPEATLQGKATNPFLKKECFIKLFFPLHVDTISWGLNKICWHGLVKIQVYVTKGIWELFSLELTLENIAKQRTLPPV